ncbi:MAG: TetR/AcrR family transcriptional regulator [Alphaproteobacteria bacterium]|nr:TetR/AcrR family transcriptional regulator [Alphaproteobacteria bacterium]MCB9699078.1 TetR/AcrR family transcriptional regulator [Alphaproteobacteria bacterium]
MVTKGERTRAEIVDQGARMARVEGLNGVSIGQLAKELSMSKSGLFAHFGSKEALQLAILEHTAAQFVDEVVRPALSQPRGEPRLRAAFERWLAWGVAEEARGGCLFVAVAAELDDRPGPVRDRFVESQRDWLDTLAQIVAAGQRDGRFRTDVDPEQAAFELHGILLATHQAFRLFRDPAAHARARIAFDRLVTSLAHS